MSIDARISTGLPAHPKTKKLARRLGPAGPLGCIYLFLWAASNRSDGNLAGLSDEDIELAIDWSGEDGAFVAAMEEVGFLDGAEGSRTIHDWAEHNPWAAGAEARSEKSRWAALCKQHGRQEAARMMPEYAKRISDSCQKVPVAVPEGASGTQLADSGSAPSPFLSVSLPSPSPKELEEAKASLSTASPKDGESVGDDDSGEQPGRPVCPHQRIVALYHEILPELRQVRDWNETRRRLLGRRWSEQPERQDLEWWRGFFGYVRESDFLMGKTTGRDGRPFDCDLEWLVRPTNFAKVIEGKYENDRD